MQEEDLDDGFGDSCYGYGMSKRPLGTDRSSQSFVPAAIIGAAFLLGCFMVKASLDRTADQLDGIRLGLADAKRALESLGQAPQAAPAQAAQRRGPDPDKRHTVNIAGAPAKGPAGAKVKIVEFSDFQ